MLRGQNLLNALGASWSLISGGGGIIKLKKNKSITFSEDP